MNIKRSLVLFKYTLHRGYQWCQLPTLAVVGSGIIKPYFPNWSIITLAITTFAIFIGVGFLDRYLGLLHTELSYATEMNPTLMKGLGYKEENK